MNRIKITGHWASRALTRSANLSLGARLHEWLHHIIFKLVMFQLDLMFWKNRFDYWIRDFRVRHGLYFWGNGKGAGPGFEEELEKNMRMFAKDNLGIEVPSDAFDG